MHPQMSRLEPIHVGSVADLAYRRIRTLIEAGELAPSTRLQQGDLADALAISRSTVREALHRLTVDDLVEFQANRGFFVASFRLGAVLERLELRVLMEPGIARLAAERRTEADVAEIEGIIDAQLTSQTPQLAHDMSREFHIALARTTGNTQFVRLLDSLWSLEIGRQLLARRSELPGWREDDAAQHRDILDAVAARDADAAAARMEQHVTATLQHWSKQATGEREAGVRTEHPSKAGRGRTA
jgi:DNA-binding GntR family transcriptional regulator